MVIITIPCWKNNDISFISLYILPAFHKLYLVVFLLLVFWNLVSLIFRHAVILKMLHWLLDTVLVTRHNLQIVTICNVQIIIRRLLLHVM